MKKTIKCVTTIGRIVEGKRYPLIKIHNYRYHIEVDGVVTSYPMAFFLY